MDNEFTSCCFTGYRPNKFPFSLDGKSKQYKDFENALFSKILELIDDRCLTFYSGMAMGFDIIAAENVLLCKKARKDAYIKLVCAIPFINQTEAFTKEWKKRYQKVLAQADEVILISDSYYKGCYTKRNEFMVNSCDYVMTWFDGKMGGTRSTLLYAEGIGRHIINLNNDPFIEQFPQTEYIID